MRRVAKALGVSRSQLHERLRHGLQGRRRYEKAEDASLWESVRRLLQATERRFGTPHTPHPIE